MKMMLALMGAALLSTNGFAAQPMKANCICENCECTPENHCGCLSEQRNDFYALTDPSPKGCQCGKGCGCGKGNKR